MKVPVKPSPSQKKATKAKYKAKGEEAQEKQKARVKFYSNDTKAQNAVKQMTGPKGYASDPLKPRGGDAKPAEKEPKTLRFKGSQSKTIYQ